MIIPYRINYLKEPEKYINEWRKAKPFPELNIREDLIRDENCDLIIVHQQDKPDYHHILL